MPALLLALTLTLAFSAAVASPPPADATTGEPPPVLRVRIGPDSNACGITLPRGKPAAKPGLILWLHGGMRGADREKGFEAHRALLPFVSMAPGGDHILCSPSAYRGREWPTPQGVAVIDALIAHMTSNYPIDTGNINLAGVSDGCLGVIAYGLRGKVRINRHVLISSAPQLVLPVESLPNQPRLAHGTWDFLQGGRDRLFPADQVVPYLKRWEAFYPNARLHYFPEGEHDFSFYSAHAPDLLKGVFASKMGSREGRRAPQKTQAIQNPRGKN